MSDTPRTDELAQGWDEGLAMPSQMLTLASQLERENAALRAAIAESEEFARKNGETLAAKVKELLAENATLRACAAESNEYARKHVEAYYQLMEALGRDRGRLDFLESTTGSGWASLLLAEGKWLTRKEIDRRMATEPKP